MLDCIHMNRRAAITITIFSLFLSIFFSLNNEVPHILSGFTFLSGTLFGLLLFSKTKLRKWATSVQNPIKLYGFAMLSAGLLLEFFAYIGNIPRIVAGKEVFLFSPILPLDLLIGLPHYITLAFVWVWFLKRYKLSLAGQFILIGLFWGVKVDQFHHFFALLSGNVIDFIVAGGIVACALCWPLLILEEAIARQYPNRISGIRAYAVSIPIQVIPFLVLFATAFVYYVLILGH